MSVNPFTALSHVDFRATCARMDSCSTPVSTERVSDVIAERLAAAIRDGTLQPGDRLPTEAELAREFQVGRTSVREGLQKLRAHGLIESRKGLGAFVTTPPASDPLADFARWTAVRPGRDRAARRGARRARDARRRARRPARHRRRDRRARAPQRRAHATPRPPPRSSPPTSLPQRDHGRRPQPLRLRRLRTS